MTVKSLIASIFSASLLWAGGTALFTLAPTAVAQATSAKAVVDTAITKGQVGETISGYLEVVSADVSQDIKDAVNEINIGRKSVYTRLAREQNVSIEVLATLTGEKQLAKAKPGTKVKDATGQWKTK